MNFNPSNPAPSLRKRSPVIMPVEPPYEVLRAMAGDPVILAADEELCAYFQYKLIRHALMERKRK